MGSIFGDWSKGNIFADKGPLGFLSNGARNDRQMGIRQGFREGKSFEEISRLTGEPIEYIRSQAPRGYGIKSSKPTAHMSDNNAPGGYSDLGIGIYGSGAGRGGGGSSNRASAAQLAEYQQGIDQATHNLGRVDTQLGVRRANINDMWKKKSDALDSAVDRARNQYETQVTQNRQQRRNDVNLINDRASGDLRGLLSVLGARGANGSDIDKVARAVQDKATRERSGSGSAYAKNAQDLDVNWNNFQQDTDKERRDLNDWKVNEERGAERDAETQRQGLHTLLAQLRSQQAEARGQNGANAARADLNRSRELSGHIDNLARLQTTHTGKDVVYKPRSLDSYRIEGDTEVKVNDSSGLSGDQSANIYDTRRAEEDRKKKNQYL